MGDEGGLVALAAMGDGGKERRVRFNEDAVRGGEGGGFADGLGCGVGDVTGEGEIEAEFEGAAGVLYVSGEAVHDAWKRVGLPVFREEGNEVLLGIRRAEFGFGLRGGELGGAAVDEDWFPGLCGDVKLGEEGLLLDIGCGVIDVVVVQADLADGDTARIGCERAHAGESVRGGVCRFLGVDADAGEDGGKFGRAGRRGDFKGAVHFGWTVADADGEDGADFCFGSADEDMSEILIGVHIEMSMGINEHIWSLWQKPCGSR